MTTTPHLETSDDLLKLNPCSEGLEYARKYPTLFDAWEACERGDWMIWFLRKKGLLDKMTSVKLAVKFAQRVLHIYEGKYSDNLAPRQAIEAALEYLENPTEENQEKCRKDRSAAYAAAAAAADAAYATAADAAIAANAANANAAWQHFNPPALLKKILESLN